MTDKYSKLYAVACCTYVGVVLLYIGTFWLARPRFALLFFGLSIPIYVLRLLRKEVSLFTKLVENKENIAKIIAIVVGVIGIAIAVYFFKEYPYLLWERLGVPNTYDRIFGAFALLLVLIAVFSYSGPPIASVVGFFIVYALFGQYFPGVFRFSGFSIARIINICAADPMRGLFGDLFQLAATLVAIFVIFAGFLKALGGFDVIIKVSLLIARKSKYLISQAAVLGSAVLGMFCGSGSANVAATGSITIPLMKSYNIRPHFAGAIESVASAGGQIMPPIMGVAAFLMAEMLGVPYVKIAIMGILPALLFFMGVGFSTHHISKLEKIVVPTFRQEENKMKGGRLNLFIDAIPLLISLLSLIVLLAVIKFDAIIAGFYTLFILIITMFIKHFINSRLGGEQVKLYLKKFGKMLMEGAKNSAGTVMEIAFRLACVGVILVIFSTSGLALKLNMLVLSAARENIWLILLLGAIVCILLGCVVSTVAVYVLAAVTVAPALLRVGIDPFVAHFYVFWFAILGLITPPVAGNVLTACGIAKSGFLKTAREAMKIGIGLLVLPIAMILYPEILIHNAHSPIIFILLAVAAYALSVFFYGGYILPGRKGLLMRLLFGPAAGALIAPINEYIKYIIAAGVLLFVFRGYIIKFIKERGYLK